MLARLLENILLCPLLHGPILPPLHARVHFHIFNDPCSNLLSHHGQMFSTDFQQTQGHFRFLTNYHFRSQWNLLHRQVSPLYSMNQGPFNISSHLITLPFHRVRAPSINLIHQPISCHDAFILREVSDCFMGDFS